MRLLYDSVTASRIPTQAVMVAGYVDGLYRWSDQDWARFPAAVKVRIAVHPSTNDGHVLDCEQGDASPAQCPAWVVMRRAAGQDPSVYCSLAVWPEVQQAFARANVEQPHYWIAAYPGNGAQLYAGAVAHQYVDQGPYDLSVVADFWPGVDQGEEEMSLTSTQATQLTSIFADVTALWKGYPTNQEAPPAQTASTPVMLQQLLERGPVSQGSGGNLLSSDIDAIAKRVVDLLHTRLSS